MPPALFIKSTVVFISFLLLAQSGSSSDVPVAMTIYVAKIDVESQDGSKEQPFDSLEKARDYLREIRSSRSGNVMPAGPIVICLREGEYSRRAPFRLDGGDGGTKENPVVYRAFEGESVSLSGGVTILPELLEPVSEASILNRLPAEVRSQVRKLDFKKAGVDFTDFGGFRYWQKGGLTYPPPRGAIWIDDEKLEPSRFPKRHGGPDGGGFVFTGKVRHTGSIPRHSVVKDPVGGIFEYTDDEVGTWENHRNIWLYGYLKETYADGLLRIKTIDRDARTIEVEQASWYGIGEGGRYTYLNVLEQLSLPGEYYTDEEKGIVYLIPPKDLGEKGAIEISISSEPLIEIDGADYVTVSSINCKLTRGDAIRLKDAGHVTIENLEIKNIEGNGIIMPELGDGNNAIQRVEFKNLGGRAFSIGGGDLKTQRAGNSVVSDCRVSNFGLERSGKSILGGVGNLVRHCEFSECREGAIAIKGNANVVEYSKFRLLNTEGSDAGAIYMGRNPSETGIKIQNNFFQDIGNALEGTGIQGVYVDDRSGFVEVRDNIFHRVGSGRQAAAFKANGGYYNLFENNIVVAGRAAFMQVHNTTPEQWRNWYTEKSTVDRLAKVDFPNPKSPWALRYPVAFAAASSMKQPDSKTNVLKNNIVIRGDLLDGIVKGRYAEPGVTKEGNLVIEDDPGFENIESGNFRIPEAVMKAKFPTFKWIDFDRIGVR
ncbi:MAG: right-handed parallel beta-helix repeat-containing protein [Verrucomicrobiales bacterium]|nr:right-handed parallel beta-helix repeat-containing protein [Verrucomicrobiales bacterium]